MRATLEKYLLARIKFGTEDECWPWLGSRNQGYGRLMIGGKQCRAHRIVFEWKREKIPNGLQLDHLCRNRGCVNPKHLEIVDHRTNVLRGISPAAKRAKQTDCINGHALSGDNLGQDHRGHRKCNACQYIYHLRHRAKRRTTALASSSTKGEG